MNDRNGYKVMIFQRSVYDSFALQIFNDCIRMSRNTLLLLTYPPLRNRTIYSAFWLYPNTSFARFSFTATDFPVHIL